MPPVSRSASAPRRASSWRASAARPALVALLAVLTQAAAGAVASNAQEPRRSAAELQLERRLLSLDLIAYKEVRAREETARGRLAEVLRRLDQALAGDSLSLGALESLYDEAAAAREAARTAAERVDRLVERTAERMRRIAILSEQDGGRRAAARNPLSGRWRVTVGPGDRGGTFELRLAGTVVTGHYRMDGGAEGSLRGTYTGGVVNLNRIDAKGGSDSSFLGTVNEPAGTITGLWQARNLTAGTPSNGGWSALRVETGSGQQP